MKLFLNKFKSFSPFKKALSVTLSTLILAQAVMVPINVMAAKSANNNVRVVQNDVYVDINQNLEDLGNRYYKMTIDAESYIKDEYRTKVQEYSEDGYQIVEKSGYYLIELWGGNGAAGSDADLSGNKGGLGGDAGYVYGYTWLEKGQTILFTIGTDGEQAQVFEGGGGANEGGNHETWSIYEVGGGGGYSAVYLFDYTKSKFSLNESERLNNYVMIAGGGGGGGAGGNLFENTGNRPSGGDAGHINNSLSGHLTAEDNSGVAGTYFAGRDGRSSGNRTDYIGRGGTNVPGKMPTTWTGYTGVLNPNDWTGTYSDGIDNEYHDDYDLTAGCGGMGARRGGAGGAGFCGGSGGFQTALSISTNIGGGGGGSSFIADSITYRNLPDYVSKYLNNDNYSGVGGSCIITFLGSNPALEKVDTTHMQDVELKGKISQYFNIQSVTASNGTVSFDANGNIQISNANIAPDESGYRKNSLNVEIMLKAKDTFAGGNNVPITTTDGYFKLTPIDHDTISVDAATSSNYNQTNYANVALKGFEAIGHSYMSNDPDREYQLSELYTNNIPSLKSELDCSFLTIDTSYTVKNLNGTAISTSPVKVNVTDESKTTQVSYYVGFNVSPANTTVATIGEPVTAIFVKDTSTLTYVSADAAGTLNGLDIDATKLLSHNGENYKLSTNVNQKGTETFVPNATQNISASQVWTAPQDGWYYVQAWGGNGGDGGSTTLTWGFYYNPLFQSQKWSSGSSTRSGGTGGKGGTVSNFVYLQEGEKLYLDIGARGTTGQSGTSNADTKNERYAASSGGGGGGQPTTVRLNDNSTVLMSAGGGGGGGGNGQVGKTYELQGGLERNDYARGSNGRDSTVVNTSGSATSGGSGGSGSASWKQVIIWLASYSGGSAGSAGVSYKNTSFGTTQNGHILSPAAQKYAEGLTTEKEGTTSGLVRITMLETEEINTNAEQLYGLETSGTISKYFDIKSIDLETAFDYSTQNITNNDDGSITVTYTKNSATVARVTYKLTANADGSTSWTAYDTYYSPDAVYEPATVDGVQGNYVRPVSSIDFVLTLSPKDGFIGGNDVPLVWYETNGADDTGLKVTQNSQSLWLNKKDISDYANVEINYDFSDDNFATTDKTIICGESVDQAYLITSNNIPLANNWTSEFVTAVYPTTTTVSPRETTSYEFTQQVVPKADAQKAVVIDSVDGVSYTKTATVYVNYTVATNLQNMTYKGPDTIVSGDGLSAVLEADGGYLLPDSISVSVGGVALSAGDFTYDSATGNIAITADKINGNIVISANAKILTYGIYYNYEDPITKEQIIVKETGHGGEWAAGEAIDPNDLVKYNELNSGVTDRIGYEFTWEWGTDDGNPVTVMPAGDLYVVGLYEPIVYTVTIHYVEEGTNTPLFEDYIGQYYYQDDYSVISPNIAGYLAKQTVIGGTVGTENIELTVEYTKTQGQLNIVYVYGDSQTTAAETYTKSIAVGDSYNIPSPEFTGYTADQTVVSGTVTGEQADSGINVYVTYNPNQYTVSFDAAGGSLQSGEESKTVAYNNIYGFDPTKPYGEQYYALPTPIRTGYEFVGWQDINGNTVTDDTVVTLTQNHTLTAKWKGQEFTLTVNYYYSEVGGELAAPKHVTRVEYNTEYNIPSPYIEGYTPAPDVRGVMGAGSRIVNVVYTIDQHSITVKYIGPNGETMTNDYEAVQDYKTTYAVTSPTFVGYELDADKNGKDLSTVSGTVGIEDIVVEVYYKYIDYTLTINYLIDDEALKPETFIREGLHIDDVLSVDSPVIEGYTPTLSTVSVSNMTSDLTYNVTYTRNSYTLKINYVYGDDILDTSLSGTQVQSSSSYSIKYGAEYNYPVPVISGYDASVDTVSGVMPSSNIEVTVYYNQVIGITVEWGNLTFDYNEAIWDDETHQYSIPPEVADTNYISITNTDGSSIKVGADVSYTANMGFESVNGYFTLDGSSTPLDAPSSDIAIGETVKYWLWLKGIMPNNIDYSSDTQQTTGTCTVTIGGAN